MKTKLLFPLVLCAFALIHPNSLRSQHDFSLNVGPEYTWVHYVRLPSIKYNGSPHMPVRRGRAFNLGYRGTASWTYQYLDNNAFQLGFQFARHRMIKKLEYQSWRGSRFVEQRRNETNIALAIGFLTQKFSQPRSAYFRFSILTGAHYFGNVITTTQVDEIQDHSTSVSKPEYPDEDMLTLEFRFATGYAFEWQGYRCRIGPYADIGVGMAFVSTVMRGQAGIEMEIDVFGGLLNTATK